MYYTIQYNTTIHIYTYCFNKYFYTLNPSIASITVKRNFNNKMNFKLHISSTKHNLRSMWE